MSLFGYAAFWLAALAICLGIFHVLYGRHALRLLRVLLGENTPETDRHQVWERVHQFFERLLQKWFPGTFVDYKESEKKNS
jgi:hypothetical protein